MCSRVFVCACLFRKTGIHFFETCSGRQTAPFDLATLDSEEFLDECEELDTKAMPYQPPKKKTKGGVPDFNPGTLVERSATVGAGE